MSLTMMIAVRSAQEVFDLWLHLQSASDEH